MTQQDWRVKTTLLRYRLAKFNPNHDEAGRFASAGGRGGRDSMSGTHAEIVNALNRNDRIGSGGRSPKRAYKLMAHNVSILSGNKVTPEEVKSVAESLGRTRRQERDAHRAARVARAARSTFQEVNDQQPELPFSKPKKQRTAAEERRSRRKVKRESRQARRLSKFNPNHDSGTGQFTSGPGGGSGAGGDRKAATRRVVTAIREGGGSGEYVNERSLKQEHWLLDQYDDHLNESPHEKTMTAKPPSGWETKIRVKDLQAAWGIKPGQRSSKISKFNQNHDEIGRFSDADGNTTGVGGPGADSKKGGDKKGGGKPGSHKGNPIKTGDVKEALRLLSEGKHVELETVQQVSTMVRRLNEIVQDAKEKGKDAPSYDLCKVSVANTNIFCAEHKGIPRLKMPQLKGKPVKGKTAAGMKKDKDGEVDVAAAFIQKMKDDGVKVTKENVKSNTLRASQSELVGRKVAGMIAAAERKEFDPEAGTIYVSKDGYIIDGHHRWAATIGLDAGSGRLGDRTINVVRVDMSITQVLKEANDFTRDIGIEPKKG